MRNCKGIWENATEREWKKLFLPFEEPIIIHVVQEFYLALKQREAAKPFYEIHSFVTVRGVNVLVTEKIDLKEFKNIEISKGREWDVDISNGNNNT
ncbi:hypothetical protein Gotur_033425 [Gossypium turneri]